MQKVSLDLLPTSLTQRLPMNANEATKKCATCGSLIMPKKVVISGEIRYIPGKCTCQEMSERQQLARSQYSAIMEAAARNTYTWLRGQPSDLALQKKTFENFDESQQEHAYIVARMFSNNPCGTLVLYGSYGTGKTHLLAAVCNAVIKRPMKSLFTTAPKLFAAIQQCIQRNEDYQTIINQAIETPLLVLDDIDKAKHSPHREEVYFSIVNERVNAGRPIAISTNRLDELTNFVGGAVCSRLRVGQMTAEMIGKDFRAQNK